MTNLNGIGKLIIAGIRFIFTGHACGATQMWDLSTALEFFSKGEPTSGEGGPTPQELVRKS